MNDEIKSGMDKIISDKGIDGAKKSITDMLSKSLSMKSNLEKQRKPLLNIPSHINLAYELLNYIDEVKIKMRDDRMSQLLGENRKILNFKEFSLF